MKATEATLGTGRRLLSVLVAAVLVQATLSFLEELAAPPVVGHSETNYQPEVQTTAK